MRIEGGLGRSCSIPTRATRRKKKRERESPGSQHLHRIYKVWKAPSAALCRSLCQALGCGAQETPLLHLRPSRFWALWDVRTRSWPLQLGQARACQDGRLPEDAGRRDYWTLTATGQSKGFLMSVKSVSSLCGSPPSVWSVAAIPTP